MRKVIFILIGFPLFKITISYAQPGTLDPSFGTGGKVTVSFQPPEDVGRKAVLQPDGKIVQTGYSYNSGIALVRYNANGTLDSTFDGDGKVATVLRGYDDEGYDVAIQGDGKIVVAGVSYDNSSGSGGKPDFAVVRYNSDGTIDSSFGSDGNVITTIGSVKNVGYSLTIQSDGKILIAGYSMDANSSIALLRYNIDGSPDSSFDGDGKVTTSIGSVDDVGFSVSVQPDGKIVVTGYSSNGSDYDFALVRYSINGSLDSSFDGDGKVTTAIGSGDDLSFSEALQADGKILVAGRSFNGSDYDFALARYNTNGSLDSSFDGDGIVTTPVGASQDLPWSVTTQSNGKIVVAGEYDNGSDYDFAMARYNTDGSLDSSFDSDGIVTTDFSNASDEAQSVIVASDGKIVLAWGAYTTQSVFAVARYNGDAALPINLISFTATNIGKSVLLVWRAAELNNAYFAVERSTNGINFSEIARVKSKGNSSQPQRYSYEDLSFSSGQNYYRLKQVDLDGKLTYSNIVRVDFFTSQTIKLYPNPVKNILSITGLDGSSNTTLSVVDVWGRMLQRITTTGPGYTYNLQQLKAGSYYLKVEANKKITTFKFIKQ